MTDQEMLGLYKNLVPFLATICGEACEIVLHNVKNPKNSIIAISNGFHSGRKTGDPLTDLSYRIVKNGEYKDKEFLSNYSGMGKGKDFISSTYFIKNNGKLIGLLCLNRDVSSLAKCEMAFKYLKEQFNLSTENVENIKENLDPSVPMMLHTIVSNAINDTGIRPDRMNKNDKIAIVGKLAQQGVLGMKGSVPEIAKQLGISEPTVYRYIKLYQK